MSGTIEAVLEERVEAQFCQGGPTPSVARSSEKGVKRLVQIVGIGHADECAEGRSLETTEFRSHGRGDPALAVSADPTREDVTQAVGLVVKRRNPPASFPTAGTGRSRFRIWKLAELVLGQIISTRRELRLSWLELAWLWNFLPSHA
jgi:hypothetical protein